MNTVLIIVGVSVGGVVLVIIVYLLANPERAAALGTVFDALSSVINSARGNPTENKKDKNDPGEIRINFVQGANGQLGGVDMQRIAQTVQTRAVDTVSGQTGIQKEAVQRAADTVSGKTSVKNEVERAVSTASKQTGIRKEVVQRAAQAAGLPAGANNGGAKLNGVAKPNGGAKLNGVAKPGVAKPGVAKPGNGGVGSKQSA